MKLSPLLFSAMIALTPFILTGCADDGLNIDRGFNDVSISAPNAGKNYSLNGGAAVSCGPATTCNAVYYDGIAGNGVAVKHGVNVWKIYRSLGDSTYKATYNNGEPKNVSISIQANTPSAGLYTITVNTTDGDVNLNNGDIIVAQKY